MSHWTPHQNNEWQNHQASLKGPSAMTENDFPSLQDSAKSKNNRRNRQVNLQTHHHTPSSPSPWARPHEWTEEEVAEGNAEVVYSVTQQEIREPEKDLKMVVRKYTDKVTQNSRFGSDGYSIVIGILKEKIGAAVKDPSTKYRSFVLSNAVKEFNGQYNGITLTGPNPNSIPDWKSKLPDDRLNEEFQILCKLRVMPIDLGPRKILILRNECVYKSLTARTMPIYRTSASVLESNGASKVSQSIQSGVENSSRMNMDDHHSSLPSHSVPSTSHNNHPHSYGNQSSSNGPTEFYNSRYTDRREDRDEYRNYEKYDQDGYSNNGYGNSYEDNRSMNDDQDWRDDSDYGRRRDDQYDQYEEDRDGRGDGRDHRDYEYDEECSRYESDYDRSEGRHVREYGHRIENEHRASTKVEWVKTIHSTKTPAWRETERNYSEKNIQRRADRWRALYTKERAVLWDKEEMREDEKRNYEADRRMAVNDFSLSSDVKKAFRCLKGIPINSNVAMADDMGRIELSTWDFETDAEEMKERMNEKYGLEKIEREINEEIVQLALPQTQITLAVSAGANAEILFEGDCHDLLVKGVKLEKLLKRGLEGVIKNRELTSVAVGKKNFCNATVSRETDTILTFDSASNANYAVDDLELSKINAERIPRTLVTGFWDGSYAKRECVVELEWQRKAVRGFLVHLPNLANEEDQLDLVMRFTSEHFTHVTSKIHRPNRMFVPLPWSPYSIDDDRSFLWELLSQNGICVSQIDVLRVYDDKIQTIDTEEKKINCCRAINRRLLKIAIDERVWAGYHPTTADEWNMMLLEARFSWRISLPDDGDLHRAGMNSATIIFDSFEQGEIIARKMQSYSPCISGDNAFLMNKEDRKGVFARAKLRVHYNVPIFVRSLIIDRLRLMDEKWRAVSHFSHAEMNSDREVFTQWACLISDDDASTPPGYCRLIVEGFPSDVVDDCCTELLNVIKGDILNCEGEEEWLLTGIGRNMADVVAQHAVKEQNVLIDFNVLGKEIRLFGERKETEFVERRLKELTRNRLKHVIRTRITIGQPLYFNRTCQAIVSCGGLAMMEKAVGECAIKLCPDDADKRTIVFDGTVAAFDRLKIFLADLDDLLRESAMNEYEKKRIVDPSLKDPSLSPLTSSLLCPVCSCHPSSDFYRLESCGHVYCIQCIYHQLSSKLGDRSFPLICCHEKCNRSIAVSDLINLLIGDTNSFRLEHLDEIKLRPLVNAIVANALLTKRDRLVPCRTADCAGIFRRGTTQSLLRCKTCTKMTCGGCGYEPHRPYSCEEYEHLRENTDASLATYVKDTNSKVRKCPKESCSAVIEKTVGCNHMECSFCRTHFCWLCGFSGENSGDIYRHMQEKHDGNGLHMDEGEMFMLQFDD